MIHLGRKTYKGMALGAFIAVAGGVLGAVIGANTDLLSDNLTLNTVIGSIAGFLLASSGYDVIDGIRFKRDIDVAKCKKAKNTPNNPQKQSTFPFIVGMALGSIPGAYFVSATLPKAVEFTNNLLSTGPSL